MRPMFPISVNLVVFLDHSCHYKQKIPYKLMPNPFELEQKFSAHSRTFLPLLFFIGAPPAASITSISRMNSQVSSGNLPVLRCVGQQEWLSPSAKQPGSPQPPQAAQGTHTMLFSRAAVVSTGHRSLGKPWPGLSLWIQCYPIKVRRDGKTDVFLKHLSSHLSNIPARFSHCSPLKWPELLMEVGSCCPERFVQAANTTHLLSSAQGQAEMLWNSFYQSNC